MINLSRHTKIKRKIDINHDAEEFAAAIDGCVKPLINGIQDSSSSLCHPYSDPQLSYPNYPKRIAELPRVV